MDHHAERRRGCGNGSLDRLLFEDETAFASILKGYPRGTCHRVNSDTALLFKQLGLFLKAEERRMQVPELHCLPTAFALESPEDPMDYLGPEVAANFPSFGTSGGEGHGWAWTAEAGEL